MEHDGVGGDGHFRFYGMLFVVEAETAHRLDIFGRERGEKELDRCDLGGNRMSAENVAGDDARGCRFGNVAFSLREDGIAVVGTAIFG